MDDRRFRQTYLALGLSQTGIATFLGVNARVARRWAIGDSFVPLDAALLLELMLSRNITPDQARALAGLPPADQSLDSRPGTALLMLIAVVLDHDVPITVLSRLTGEHFASLKK